MTSLLLIVLKTTGVFMLATVLAMALRRQAASFRHLVWSVALLSALAIPFIPANNAVSVPAEVSAASTQTWLPSIIEAPKPDEHPLASVPEAEGSQAQTRAVRPREIAMALWGIGLAGTTLTTLLGLFRARRLVAESRKFEAFGHRGIELRASDTLSVPVALWAGRFYIVLPSSASDWSEERVRNVLAHETAHLQRWDPIWLLVGRFACAIHWFNPLAWLALSKMRDEAELAADDAVIRSGVTASGYAADLMALSRPERVPSAALSLGRPTGLAQRIRRLVQEDASRRGVSARAAAALSVAGVFAVAPIASMRLVGTSQEPTELASVRTQVTEATTPSGLKVSFLATSDGQRAWNARWKWVTLPPRLPIGAHPNPGSRLIVFTFTQSAADGESSSLNRLDAIMIDGAKIGSGVGTSLPLKDGKVQILSGYWVRPIPPAESPTWTFKSATGLGRFLLKAPFPRTLSP